MGRVRIAVALLAVAAVAGADRGGDAWTSRVIVVARNFEFGDVWVTREAPYEYPFDVRSRRPALLVPSGVFDLPPVRWPSDKPGHSMFVWSREFTFHLEPGLYRVHASVGSTPVGTAALTVPVAGAVLLEELDLKAPEVVRVRGRITWHDGRPFVGRIVPYQISLVPRALSPGEPTDEAGHFSITFEREPGPMALGALVPGRSAVLWSLAGSDESFGRVIDPMPHVVQGTVLDDATGEPIARATVRATQRGAGDGPGRYERTTTDEAGRFELTHVGPAGEVVVSANRHANVVSTFADGSAVHVRLPLPGGIRGRVALPEGVPWPKGLRVWAWLQPEGELPGVDFAIPDADGRFELRTIDPVPTRVYAAGGGWIGTGVAAHAGGDEAAVPPLAVRAGETVEIELNVERAGAVAGRVTGADGKPIAGALVRAKVEQGTDRPLGSRLPGTEGVDGSHCAATAADGTYRIEGLIPGIPYRVTANAVGLTQTMAPVVTAGSGETATADVRLPGVPYVEVVVVDALTGQPVSGAAVYVSSLEGRRAPSLGESGRTNREGRFRLGAVFAGSIRVSVSADGYATHQRVVERRTNPVYFALTR